MTKPLDTTEALRKLIQMIEAREFPGWRIGMTDETTQALDKARESLAAVEQAQGAVSSIDQWQKRGHHVCPDCNGTRVRSYRQADHLGGQYVDVPCPTCAHPAPQGQDACTWTPDSDPDYSMWETGCGQAWSFTTEGPKENGMKFCHSCGKRLVIAEQTGEQPEPDCPHSAFDCCDCYSKKTGEQP